MENGIKFSKKIEGRAMTLKEVTVYVKTTRGVEYAYKISLDNAMIHHAKTVKIRAEELDIHFIYPSTLFFPPYSPDLNPIELGWKDLKRELSNILYFNEMIKSCEGVALDLLDERKYGYSRDLGRGVYKYQELLK